jgi:hypothetical protein
VSDTPAQPTPPPDATDLERRVLAHERILQSLIAYMARTEPRFTDHLRASFIDPMKLTRREHDYRDAHDYAEEFVRAVIALGERPVRPQAAPAPAAPSRASTQPAVFAAVRDPPERVVLREHHGVWQIRVDGAFWGDYCEHDHALAALTLARLSLR